VRLHPERGSVFFRLSVGSPHTGPCTVAVQPTTTQLSYQLARRYIHIDAFEAEEAAVASASKHTMSRATVLGGAA
jgi:hypothetical protein